MKRPFVLLMILCLLSGCAAPPAEPASPAEPPVQEVPDAPPVEETPQEKPFSSVYTDWSKLTPYETAEPLYTYHPSYGEMLNARSDYGTLLPYVGTMSNVSNYIVDKLPLFGLVTANGKLVTGPVYSNVEWWGDFLLLYEGAPSEQFAGEWGRGQFHYTVAAPDGSWVREIGRCYSTLHLEADSQLALSMEDGSVQILNADGSIAVTFPRSAFTPFLGEDFRWNWEGGPCIHMNNNALAIWQYREEVTDNNYDLCYLHPDTGAVTESPPEGWEPFDYNDPANQGSDLLPEAPDKPEYHYLEPITDPVTGRIYFYGLRRTDADHVQRDLLDEAGQLVLSDCSMEEMFLFRPFIRAGLVSTAESNCFCYKDIATGETVFRFPVRTNSD